MVSPQITGEAKIQKRGQSDESGAGRFGFVGSESDATLAAVQSRHEFPSRPTAAASVRTSASIKLCGFPRVLKFQQNVPPQFKGGDGTSFDPVILCLKANRHENFGGCVYLTDGMASKPTIDPRCPILWMLTPEVNILYGWDQCGI